MSNNKNNVSELVSDDDPTSELEAVTHRCDRDGNPLESDATTYNYTGTEVDEHQSALSELKSDLKVRSETISRLQFDIEQLRSKWMGLEAEIKAREELTESLQDELDAHKKSLAHSDALLQEREHEILALNENAQRRDDEIAALKQAGADLESKFSEGQDKLSALLADLADRDASIVELKQQHSKLEHELSNYSQDEIEQTKKTVASQAAQLSSRAAEIRELQEQRKRTEAYADDMRRQIRDLTSSEQQADTTRAAMQSTLDCAEELVEELSASLENASTTIAELHEELDGKDAAHQQELRTLRFELGEAQQTAAGTDTRVQQLAEELRESEEKAEQTRVEMQATADAAEQRIADLRKDLESKKTAHEEEIRTLRFELGEAQQTAAGSETRLQELADELRESQASTEETRDELQGAIHAAEKRNSELSEALDKAEASTDELKQQLDANDKAHEEQIEALRLQLDEARESAAAAESVNSQLKSDLVEVHTRKEDFERILNEHEAHSQARISDLETQIERLSAEAQEFEQKLEAKTGAINGLLEEIARKSEQIESIGEIEQVIHDIDDRMSERIDVSPTSAKDRVTRLLIGNIDNQVVRFPLFKDRLTIGRTSTNDIQLKAQYISRRHAVILTEGDRTRVVDWGSKNGIFVNEKRVTDQSLRNGDILTIGNADFRYEERAKRD